MVIDSGWPVPVPVPMLTSSSVCFVFIASLQISYIFCSPACTLAPCPGSANEMARRGHFDNI